MIEIDVVTPSKRVIEGVRVDSVKLPAADGEIMILPGHTELMTLIGTGVLSFKQSGAERKFALGLGFAEIRNDKVLVLVETAETSEEIDRQRAIEAQRRAEEAIETATTEVDFNKFQLKRKRALVRQQVAGV